LGEDFDFSASRGNECINVEATALKEKEFYEGTAINALRRKSDQLATDKPAVIFCLFPSAWEAAIGSGINEWMEQLAAQFLRGTRRVNVIVFQMERRIDISQDQAKGAMVTVSRAFFNATPRHSADLGFLFEGDVPKEVSELMNDAISDSELAQEVTQRLRTGEFYRWVDYLVP
jgi:hypothetical protein